MGRRSDDESAAEHRLLFEHAADGVFIAERSGRFIDANERGLAMLGYSLDELRGLGMADVLADDVPPRFDELREGRALTTERPLRRADGSRLTAEISGAALPDGRFLGLVRDVTARKQMEADLRDSEERYRLLVEASNIGLVMFQDGRVVYANPVFAEIQDYALDDIVKLSPEEVFSLIHPDDRELVRERMIRRLEGDDGVPARYEFRIVRRSGDARWLDVSSSLVQHRGRPALQATMIDVTERRVAEDALAASERYFRQLIEASSDAIAVLSPDLALQYVSPAIERITGYTPREHFDADEWLMVPEADRERVAEAFRELASEPERPLELAGRIRRKDGASRRVELSGIAVVERGAISHFIVTLRDVTERWEAEERLARTQKLDAVGRLAGGVAHDFNNILSVIMAECGMARAKVPPEGDLAEHIGEIEGSTARAAELTRQLLSFSRHQLVEPTPFALAELVRDATRMLRRVIGEDIDLVCDFSPETGYVIAERGQIEQLVVNLAVNARDAMPGGGLLSIATRPRVLEARERGLPPGAYAELEVTDSGVGMTDEVKGRLFEPFFSTKEMGKGTGLGLATCYGIVKRFGGDIRVDSELRRGTTFQVLLPCGPSPATASQPDEGSRPALGGTEQILVVEDEGALRRAVTNILERRGYEVVTASTAERALELVAAGHATPSLLLTDMVLPGINGAALADRLAERDPDLRLVVMSGYSEERLRELESRGRRVAILEKPFAPDELARRVREALD